MNDSEDFTKVIIAKLKEDLPGFRQRVSVQFDADNMDTQQVLLQPGSGKTWYLSKIRVWTDEKPIDSGSEGSKVDVVLTITGAAGDIAELDQSEVIQDNYHTCSISINCITKYGQRLKVKQGDNTVQLNGTKTGTTTPTMYLEVEGVEE